jgi:hypothetical protein
VIPAYVTDLIRTNKRRYISRSPVFAAQDQVTMPQAACLTEDVKI